LYPYCGGHDDLIGDGELTECRRRASRRIRYHRNRLDYPVAILARGRRWELESDPDGGYLISDGEGILVIEPLGRPEDEDFFLDDEEGNDA
jgi:hypothetical protein